jgi:hypothetical protein
MLWRKCGVSTRIIKGFPNIINYLAPLTTTYVGSCSKYYKPNQLEGIFKQII